MLQVDIGTGDAPPWQQRWSEFGGPFSFNLLFRRSREEEILPKEVCGMSWAP